MICNVVACGDSAGNYDGSGFSIGVNDAFKWGHKLNHLVVVNHPDKFKKEPERMKTIIESKPDKFIAHSRSWHEWFPQMQYIRPIRQTGRVRQGIYYHAMTSPFVAISHAFNIGATEIVLWGVDMRTHKIYHDKSKDQRSEVDKYKRFIMSLSKHGVSVYLGCEGSALDLPIWKKN